MKYLILLVLLISTVQATEYEVGTGYNHMKINWIAHSSFEPNVTTVEGTAWNHAFMDIDYGLRVQYGWSDRVSNLNKYAVYKTSKARIDSMSTIQLVLRTQIVDDFYAEYSIGQGSYVQSVTNFYEKGYANRDAGTVWGIGVTYRHNNSMSIRLGYNKYHDKEKSQSESPHFLDGDGHEATESYNLTINYLL